MLYKCYILDFTRKKYYVYIKANTNLIYGAEILEKPVINISDLELLANVSLLTNNEDIISIVYDKKTTLQGIRSTNLDIKV